MEKAKGTAEMQASLASAQVQVDISGNEALAREAQAKGEAAGVEAIGVARAKSYEEQVRALGQSTTAMVAVANAVSEGNINIMPDILVNGGGGAGEGLAATLMGWLKDMGDKGKTPVPVGVHSVSGAAEDKDPTK